MVVVPLVVFHMVVFQIIQMVVSLVVFQIIQMVVVPLVVFHMVLYKIQEEILLSEEVQNEYNDELLILLVLEVNRMVLVVFPIIVVPMLVVQMIHYCIELN